MVGGEGGSGFGLVGLTVRYGQADRDSVWRIDD